MKIVLQRVSEASVKVGGAVKAKIGKGFLLLVGIGSDDTEETASTLAHKVSKLRVFEDEDKKMNLALKAINGEILSVPQFTLLGNTDKGNRPGFDDAASPEKAESLWRFFNKTLVSNGINVQEGEFGAHMDVSLVNDGPVTFVLDVK